MPEPVLILMDYQEDICREDGDIGRSGVGAEVVRRGVLEAARGTLHAFRDRGAPIVHVRTAFDDDYGNMTSGSPRFAAMRERRMLLDEDPGSAICPEVAPDPGEVVIRKGCVNPFVGTPLHSRLVALGAMELVLGGVATNHVVETTARYAADVGYSIVVLEDLCASFDEELHVFSASKMLPMFGRVTVREEYLSGWGTAA